MADLLAPLRAHAPFDELEPAAFEFLAKHLELAYYARGAVLVSPETGPVERLFIVKQGVVRGSGGRADVMERLGEHLEPEMVEPELMARLREAVDLIERRGKPRG